MKRGLNLFINEWALSTTQLLAGHLGIFCLFDSSSPVEGMSAVHPNWSTSS
jgi:hypothetical protein